MADYEVDELAGFEWMKSRIPALDALALCGENIPAMKLCWVTKCDPYVLLCDACRTKVAAAVADA